MLFSKFPDITYNNQKIKDLSIALIVRPEIKNNKDLFFWYNLEEWESPESVAFDFYGNSAYNFIILLMNDIVDPFFDWPLSRSELVDFAISKYGLPTITDGKYDSNGYFSVKFWRKDGIHYPNSPNSGLDGSAPPMSEAVSHFQFEEEKNNARRRIKILHPGLLGNLREELDALNRAYPVSTHELRVAPL